MNFLKLISRTLRHYPWSSVATAAGIAIATAVICGALIIGYSLTRSLEQIVEYRLGNTTHSITAGERLFTTQLSAQLNNHNSLSASPVLKTEGIAGIQGSDARVNRVQIWGIDSSFAEVAGNHVRSILPADGELVVSKNLAARLEVDTGDFLLLRMRTLQAIPGNTPFVSGDGQSLSRRMIITAIADKDEMGHLNLQSSQTAPYNAFVNLQWLNRVMDLEGIANLVLVNDRGNTATSAMENLIRESVSPEDLGLQLEALDTTGSMKLTAARVFLDDYVSEQISDLFPDAKQYLTYFANTLMHGQKQTPYSFVSAVQQMEGIENKPGGMVINQWLAEDLGLNEGDSVKMRYFVVGPLRELEEFEHSFRVVSILPMERAEEYSHLMPHLPGLSDAGSCRDWDAGIPIELDKIRQKDEDYWDAYRGTPKAFISLEEGQKLWQNRFGNLTTVIFPDGVYEEEEIRAQLSGTIDPFRLEFQLNPLRERGLEAARGGVDFGQLFAGLGMFLIASGLLLTVLLLQFSLQRRKKQIDVFTSLGFPSTLVRKIILTEAFVITLAGALAGLLLSVGYTRLVFSGLNKIWYDIVRTDVLTLHFHPWSLLAGVVISVVLGMLVVTLGLRRIIAHSTQLSGLEVQKRKKFAGRKISLPFAIIFTIGFVAVLVIALLNSTSLTLWFAVGIVLLLAILFWVRFALHHLQQPGTAVFSTNVLSFKNLARNPARSFTILVLLALGSFVIVVTAANHKDLTIDTEDKTGGTGGFSFMAETTVPVLRNLNQPDTQQDYGLPEGLHFMQFLTLFEDDASCHNLNRVANPRLLGVEPHALENRFSFAAAHPLLDEENPWQSLDNDYDGFIPAIADQSVILWGLGKKLGDTLYYVNSAGEKIKLLLIGGLENSVLQGNVVISRRHFLENFPSASGSSVFLVEADNTEGIENELAFIFRDYGWDMISTEEKLAGFNTVENTYLRIFFLMGALGMLLGTVGLAILIARSMLERSSETALLKAMGYPGRTIFGIYFREYIMLFAAGLLTGIVAALIATLPSYLSGVQNVAPGFLLTVLGIIIINGVVWIGWIVHRMIQGSVLAQIAGE